MVTVLLSSSHAVSRSSELLSCAKTACKIAQNQQDEKDGMHSLQPSPNQLALHDLSAENTSSDLYIFVLLEDGLCLLRQMKLSLNTLSSLVKRRGQTNDPTRDMQHHLHDFEHAARELSSIQIIPTPLVSKQQGRHYQYVSQWLQGAANVYTTELKQVMKFVLKSCKIWHCRDKSY